MAIFSTYFNCDPLQAGYIKKMDEILPFFVEDKFVYLPGFLGLFMATIFNGALRLARMFNFLKNILLIRKYFQFKRLQRQLLGHSDLGRFYGAPAEFQRIHR